VELWHPSQPRPVACVPAPAHTWNIHLQTHGDLLLVSTAKNMFAAGLIYATDYNGGLSILAFGG